MTDAPMPTEKPPIWTWEGRSLAILFGLGLVLWPFLSFGAIFIFDSPIQSRSDLLHRETVAYFIWFYPVTYGITCLAYHLLRKCGVWRLVSCFAWGLPAVVYLVLPSIVGGRGVEESNSKRVQLLFRTDHVALLAACQEVMSNRNTFAQRRDGPSRSLVDPKDPKIPATIVALQPRAIVAEDDVVFLDLHGEPDRYGVTAYSEKVAGSHSNDTNRWSGQFPLTPGLWFFDEELTYERTDRTEYINRLKAMRPTDAPTPNW